jgi:hypothetical protein
MKKTEQQQINDKIAECLEDLSESMEMFAKNRDLMMRLIEFGDTRIDSLENKVDVLMSERGEDDVWYNEESKKAILDDIADNTITPRALIELGFEEVYQDVDFGEAGYIFYSHEIKGVGFYSLGTDEEDFHVRMDDSEYEVRNLNKLRDLILSLKEL